MHRPGAYVDPAYLQLVAGLVEQTKQLSHDRLRLQPGQRVLDVGCGPASDTLALAARVGPTGQVLGIDIDPGMVAEADRRTAAAGLQATVSHRVADALALPLADASFDGVRAERLFQHLTDPAAALAEMLRVLRPGGWVVVLDADWGTVSIDCAQPDLERRLLRVLAERCLANGYAGRQLHGLFLRQGLLDVTVEPRGHTLTRHALARQIGRLDWAEDEAVRSGAMTPAEVQRLRDLLNEADAAGRFFCSTTHQLASGRKA